MYFSRKIHFGSDVSEKLKPMSLNDAIGLLVAYNLDPNNEKAKADISRLMSGTAMIFYRKKTYDQAAEWAQKALNLNENNKTARSLMDHLKRKHPTEI